ncbi:uncharacterized protein LOC103457205 isoform X2 [Poecilia reticulata]|uniref:uncharacterized protein LOC103457205 isoform X2 n=1 Tax=Poecilia reticulata TaxID=8081 RepID=UPI0007EAA6A0|nr:PREDICTED: uncharacterized protein LOC103457205 isoform X2 [Poecilia reticulata]
MKQRGAEEESRWRKIFSFFILMLQFAGAQSGDLFMPLAVRAGDDVTLSCENVADGHRNCNTTNWTYSHSRQSAAVTLVEHGKIKDGRSDRLSVSANCSLVLKKVTSEDVGKYTCKQLRSGRHSGPDAVVQLSVVNLTEHEEQHRRTLRCSVSTYERCKHRVKWLHMGISLDKENRDIKESSTSCSAAVTFKSSLYVNQSSLNSFKCEVKSEDEGEELKLFTFSSHSSVKSTTAVTENPTVSSGESFRKTSPNTKPETKTGAAEKGLLWLYVAVAPVTVAFIAVSVFMVLKRNKGNRIQQKSNDVDPDGAVSYASISFKKSNRSSSRIKSDDEGDVVTYSTVKTPSTDPSSS